MILTVNLNSALDWVTFIDEFIPNTVIRAEKVVESVGGKGFDTSVALSALGVPSLALGIVAGQTGRQLEELLNGYGITHDLVWVGGETRIANVIVEKNHQRHTHIMTRGCVASEADAEHFVEVFSNRVSEAAWVVIAGTMADGIPQDFMKRLLEIAHRAGVSTMVDSRGEAFQIALQAKPTISKMNKAEFQQTFGLKVESLEELRAAVGKVRERDGLKELVITLGGEGILAVTAGGSWLARAPWQTVVNAAGAGDAVSAALAWRLETGDDWPQALRWAAAVSAATVLTEGTADSHMEDVQRIYEQVEVISYS